ncbi:hypothetical protein Sxan_28980 [Streptomyces xanthophaeus]|uniref:Uncharacterized protein n=1 Tax=Streptomyces xanthophaeus TaxID=67385 RepID=A0A919LIJ0_9ACTN|nr:hypothetical protein Sxan_28980 [Streptomyces xanthophaeus]
MKRPVRLHPRHTTCAGCRAPWDEPGAPNHRSARPPAPRPEATREARGPRTIPRQQSNVVENNGLFTLLCDLHALLTAPAHTAGPGANTTVQPTHHPATGVLAKPVPLRHPY